MGTARENMMSQDGRVSVERYRHAEIISASSGTLKRTA
jgi:hypothetical protein